MPIKRKQHAIPLVLIPPLGVNSDTFDLMPQRSLVRFLAASGFKTYLVDWGKPGKKHSHLGLVDYSFDMMNTALDKIRKHSGSKELSMMGWCMGGLLILLHQGLVHDKNIRNIITVASPIDLESGSGVMSSVAGAAQALNAPAELVRNYSNLRLNMIDTSRLHIPPWLTTIIFKMTDPLSSVTTYWDLMTNLWDREFVESHSTTSDYLNNMLLYPGGVIKDMASSALAGNQFASGRVEIGDQVADLSNIKSNFLGYAGATDNLVPPDVARSIVDIIAAPDKEFREAPGGHMGVIIGSKAQKAVWTESAEWLAKRSSARVVSKRPRRKAARTTRA
jgi:polyhydroxyalkanoate synthase